MKRFINTCDENTNFGLQKKPIICERCELKEKIAQENSIAVPLVESLILVSLFIIG